MAIKLDKTQLVKNLVKRHKLVTHLDRVIGEGEFVWEFSYSPKVGDDAWHPSGDCAPSAYSLWRKGVGHVEERSFGPGLRKTFMVGHFWHQYLQHIVLNKLQFCNGSAIERRGKVVWGWDHQDCSDENCDCGGNDRPKAFHWATGSADVAPCDIPGHGEFCVDFKTMGSFDYKRTGLPDWCAAKYECQINVYMDFFDLERGLIVCVNKDSPHDMKEFVFERNEKLIDEIYDKWKLVSEWLDEGFVPVEAPEPPLSLTGPVA